MFLLIGDKMNNLNDLYVKKYGNTYTELRELFGEELSLHLVQFWNSGLEMKIATAQEDYEIAAIHRDNTKKQAKEIIEYFKENYLDQKTIPLNSRSK